jgi:recombination associated protein RdgC
MFKNLIVYKFLNEIPSVADIEKSLDVERFLPCGKSQEKSIGWIEPRGEAHAALIESISGQYIMRLQIETKTVPGAVAARKAQERADEIEKNTGRKPGKKEMREIKEEVKLSLLPVAFSKVSKHWIWIDPTSRIMAIEAAAQSKADEIITLLVKTISNLQVGMVHTNKSPQAAMAYWLTTQEAPAGFSVDRECELKALDESKSVVKFAKHSLDRDDVRKHIEEGKMPTRLAMTWQSRVSFVLSENLQLKKIAFLDVVFETANEEVDSFDADAAIATGELVKLMPDLFAALEGVVE